MNENTDRFARALEQVATDPTAEGSFSLEYVRQAGTPSYWEDRITVTGGGPEAFSTVRSAVDEGGEPIGTWSAATTGDRVRSLARRLLAARIWDLPSGDVSPGQDAIDYTYVTPAGVGSLVITADSPTVFALRGLDGELRDVANELRARHYGSELRCLIDLQRESDRLATANVVLVNDGSHGGVVPNPFRQGGGPDDYLRIEVGRAEVEEPGVTGIGIAYAPVPQQPLPPVKAPWTDAFLFLGPRARVSIPVRFSVPLPAGEHFYCRAVISNYTALYHAGGQTVFRGRAFSREISSKEVG